MTTRLPDWANQVLLAGGFSRGEIDALADSAVEGELQEFLLLDCPHCDGAGAILDLPANREPIATSPDRDCPMCKGSGRVAW